MSWLCDTLGGLWELARMGLRLRLNFSGPYWKWRMQTAFGRGMPPRGELIKATLEHGRWIHQMRRLRG